MPRQPGEHLWVFVDGVIVENDVDELARRHLSLNGVEEADELLAPVLLHASAPSRLACIAGSSLNVSIDAIQPEWSSWRRGSRYRSHGIAVAGERIPGRALSHLYLRTRP